MQRSISDMGREAWAPNDKESDMDMTTLLIIILLVVFLGGGFYGRGRWY